MTNTTKHLIGGIIHVTGEPDVGKTTFALTTGEQPENIAFLDNDVKGENIVDQIQESGHIFAYYQNLTALSENKKPVEFHEECLKVIRDMESQKEKINTIIWDNWKPFEDSLHPYVCDNMLKFKKRWSPNGTFKAMQMWSVARGVYEPQILSRLLKIANVVIITSHLTDHYNSAKVKTGKMTPEGSKELFKKAQLRIWLRLNKDGSSIPTGLVMKRISKAQVTEEGGIKIMDVLPRRIPICDWKHLKEYWDNPIGLRELRPDEIPNKEEISLLGGALTEDQKQILQLNILNKKKEAEDDAELEIHYENITERVLALWDETDGNVRPKRFVKQLQKQDDDFYDLTTDDLEAWLDERNSKKKSKRGKKKEYEEIEDDEIPN